MPDLPSHQDTGSGVSQTPIAGVSRRRKVLVAVVVVALVVLVAVLHLTGVIGGESH
ncbi:hypothetical protein [Rugosimonospora africana]|uniref:Uncharacterized protein n=1 Tax=Rugosimonospora africana TaxID=556532 RepID=A0A8J3VU24_9ACTN|nr:hypothetical protein [Rugosimonospora africana]GIH19032.1 hypothetical protein Raf01_72040 [Rugosimonospora africana]